MTKTLSLMLEAQEPEFRHTVNRLERASGNACHDIKISESLNQDSRNKIILLGLDPQDTTGEELYRSLQEKLRVDDLKTIKHLRSLSAHYVSAEGNISDGIAFALEQEAKTKKGYGVKNSVIKKFLIKNPPRRVMKEIGYRSVASMLRQEPPQVIISAALVLESAAWHKLYHQALKNMTSRDCEDLSTMIFCPQKIKWINLSHRLLSITKQTIIVNKELATVIVLPLPTNFPKAGLTLATLVIGLSGLNSIHTMGSYLKLSQVTSDFGQRLELATISEPQLGVSFIDSPLSWETVQRFFHHMTGLVESPLDDRLDIEDIIGWKPIESMVRKIVPELSFWKNSDHLCRLDGLKPVSFNLLDNAISLCNHSLYGQHIYHHAQRALWQEFISRYIRPELLSEAINQELQPKLATELVTI